MEDRILSWYCCPQCKRRWTSLWDSACDDDCPECGERHISPEDYMTVPEFAPKYSVLIVITEDVEHKVYLVDENTLDGEDNRVLFSGLVQGYGFRPILDGEGVKDYWGQFMNWKDLVEDSYYSALEESVSSLSSGIFQGCDPDKLNWQDEYMKWEEVTLWL